jgi:ATP-dependent Zn protease
MTRPENDDNHLTKAKLLDDIVMTLGGRVAEELVIKDISAGASGDIQAVTKRARLMVTEWGMSDKVGPISYGSDREVFIGRDMASHVTYSEKTAAIIDEEVTKIVDDALLKARKLLSENKNLLDNMARLLIERETIYAEEVNLLMEGKTPEEIMDFMDKNEATLSENPFERNLEKAPELDGKTEEVTEPVEEQPVEEEVNTEESVHEEVKAEEPVAQPIIMSETQENFIGESKVSYIDEEGKPQFVITQNMETIREVPEEEKKKNFVGYDVQAERRARMASTLNKILTFILIAALLAGIYFVYTKYLG